jgi:excinuclease ABC subunit A
MNEVNKTAIKISNAAENNLKHLSLEIPHNKFIVVTGVSGSGKSSLVFDVIAKEGQRKYLETYTSFSRLFMGKLQGPNVEDIDGLMPVISISQNTSGTNIRSTLGTMSEMYDMLRLLFARAGKTDLEIELSRSLFSFNSPIGACKHCNGIGLEEKIDVNKLISDSKKTLRQGALAPSQPNGYIMYSQVTIDVLNLVCNAHGFDVDTPWEELSLEQQNIILNGSTRIKVPFGKHSLESRLKWTGITAKPREEAYYKGMLPIMNDILKRDRNVNILKYAQSVVCSHCNGTRLNNNALSVKIDRLNIADFSNMELTCLRKHFEKLQINNPKSLVIKSIADKIINQIKVFENLGMGYLSLSRSSNSLTGGDIQRIRLINQISAELSNVVYVFDEPSAGMHPQNMNQLIEIFRQLVNQGNTLIVVEHDLATIMQADWIIDIGPAAGKNGGELLFNGSLNDFISNKDLIAKSPTRNALSNTNNAKLYNSDNKDIKNITFLLDNCNYNNLKNIKVNFIKGGLNIVCGIAGSGKNSLVHGELETRINSMVNDELEKKEFDKLIVINQSPIGRTPRSNPATYTKLSDKIRDVFANQDSAKKAGLTKSHFSFNNKGGRCETCQGAGQVQIGMHFLGNVNLTCSSCGGKRFNEDILKITYNEKNIAEVYELTANQAIKFFVNEKKIVKQLQTLIDLGLGYITLGQSSTTVSGGEAQRIKLATHLQQNNTGNTLYILNEPSVGLHIQDIDILLKALKKLTKKGNTIVCVENDTTIISNADHIIELGPKSGTEGGEIIFEGKPNELIKNNNTPTANALKGTIASNLEIIKHKHDNYIRLKGITTHYLKNLDVNIRKNQLTVITGLSGTGKSSLAFDTLFSESRSRFSESFSTYVRNLIKLNNPAKIESASGICPTVAISRKHLGHSNRSTVGTISGIYDNYRLLYSRIAQNRGYNYSAQDFSFNHETGACEACGGLGEILTTNPEKLITHPHLPITNGALQGSNPGKYYGDPYGRFIAIIKTIAKDYKINIDIPWQELPYKFKDIILYGTGDKTWELEWRFKNKTRSGTQKLATKWEGFCNIIDDEYRRKHQNKTIESIAALLHGVKCKTCNGSRLKSHLLKVKLNNKNIAELSSLNVKECLSFFDSAIKNSDIEAEREIIKKVSTNITNMLNTLQDLGLDYLSIDRRAGSLSGGEAQRLRIAGILSAQLYGVCYVLDEPTIGLHPKDTASLISVLKKLIARNNTVVVVEHDETFIKQADYIIEMGHEAGKNGGFIVAEGNIEAIKTKTQSVSAKLLNNKKPEFPKKRSFTLNSFGVFGAYANNLKNCKADFISGGIIAVTGVSGSGKSSLINEVLLKSIQSGKPINCTKAFGLDQFTKTIVANQTAISNNSLSTPASFSGILEDLRELFASTSQAKAIGLKKSAFSYHHKDGKCPICNGYGQIRISMDFMSDIWTMCDTCHGSRYKKEVIDIKINGLSIADILNLTISEAFNIFKDNLKLAAKLQICIDMGIRHLQLGQAANTLSGGEAQRLKLATEVMKVKSTKNLFLLDEPGTGLHYFDILKLIEVFNRLADNGNTIIFIEHNPTLINIANQIIEMGPASGNEGGEIISSNIR